jgi:hypothetical protein
MSNETPSVGIESICEAIVKAIAELLNMEPPSHLVAVRLANGVVAGRQVSIDATEKGGLLNRCRLSGFDPIVAPAGEVARIEYEDEKSVAGETIRVYSIQSVRMRGGKYVLLENFLAQGPAAVREQDFRSVTSDVYAQQTVLGTVQDWVRYREYQLSNGGQHRA